ncbi:class IV lanthionine synthetase LanL [Kitasatospora sp. NBC_01560]|uniref:class IV lanthionine synthetase LanL n=1 Tax=Kitasatospora sp. NBC_01560 TaxID=2975965 RepID=UPI00386B8745
MAAQEQQGGTGPVVGLPLRTVVRAVLAGLGADDWSVQESGVWCRVEPAGRADRVQGWKLHVSATRLSAPEVLLRAAEVLVRGGCAFKCARDLALVEEMTSHRYDRAQCGKVITAYPRDDEHFRRLARELDAATAGLPGPAVLSDRPYRPGSLVHYRYGAFLGVPTLTNDGTHEVRLRAPDGTTVTDPRKAWFSPPAWAVDPLAPEPAADATSGADAGATPDATAGAAAPAVPRPVLLNDRYVVREAIGFSARGGVYRAHDRRTGAEVVVKQARAHVGVGLPAQDARAALSREAENLSALQGLGPGLVEYFEADGHAFLVQAFVEGRSLTAHVHERITREGTGALTVRYAVDLARRLTALLAGIHRRGLVYQDFTSNNVMVTPGGDLVLIDTEHAVVRGGFGVRAYTLGYGAPEQVGGRRYGRVDDVAVDLHALGAAFCHLATGIVPAFLADEPAQRTGRDRTAALLAGAGASFPAAAVLAPAILGLLAQDPSERWSLERVTAFLADLPDDAGPATAATVPTAATGPTVVVEAAPATATAGPPLAQPLRRRLLDDGLAHLLATMAPEGSDERLWESSAFAATADVLGVQHGAAGVLAVLTRADAALHHPDLRTAVERTARWVGARLERADPRLPGLHFGRSGTAWALHDAARHLGDGGLAAHAADFALTLPVRWPNPDVCHGAAGAGLAQLHLWRATGREEFLARADACADGLVSAVERNDGQVYWPVPADFDSQLAGIRQLGFGHGVAGVGAFLLAAGLATGRRRYVDLAGEAGRTLATEAEHGPWGARWRSDRDSPPGQGMLYHWCNGSSGVGTFLLRLWQTTGDPGFRQLAEQAALAVRHSAWHSGTAACHGLAGNGQFLLDLASAVGGPYRGWTEELAGVLYGRHAVREGRLLLPDEGGRGVRADYQTGLAGSLDLLLRLDHGGGRLWMADAEADAGPLRTPAPLLGAAR